MKWNLLTRSVVQVQIQYCRYLNLYGFTTISFIYWTVNERNWAILYEFFQILFLLLIGPKSTFAAVIKLLPRVLYFLILFSVYLSRW